MYMQVSYREEEGKGGGGSPGKYLPPKARPAPLPIPTRFWSNKVANAALWVYPSPTEYIKMFIAS